MPVFRRKKMCDECPFRAAAPRGWLGPWTVDQFHDAIHGEDVVICHSDAAKKYDQGLNMDEVRAVGQHCVGIMRYRESVFKCPRDPKVRAAQEAIEKVADQSVIPPFQFRDFHSQPLGSGPIKNQRRSR